MRNIILKYGIIFGVISSIAGAMFLRGSLGMGLSTLISYGGILLVFTLAGLEYRKSQDGFASFGELLKLFFGIIVVVLIVSAISSLIHSATLDEAAKTEIANKMVDTQLEMTRSMGLPEEAIDEAEEEFIAQAETMFAPSKLIMGLLIMFPIYFLLSMIPAGILKKN